MQETKWLITTNKRGILHHAVGSAFFEFHVISTFSGFREAVNSVLSLKWSDEGRGRGKRRSIAVLHEVSFSE